MDDMPVGSIDARQRAERSITKKFRAAIWRPFIQAVQQYELIQPHERIAVCISGGKDSMLLAKLMQALHRYTTVPFELCFIAMDPGFNGLNRHKIESNAALLGIPVTFFQTNIFDVVTDTDRSPCYLCARMRRGHLYAEAQRHGCNKIALGHHLSDVAETVLMNLLYGAKLETMMPKLRSRNFPGMELIRPMYCIAEDAINAWKRYNDLQFIACGCPLAENCNILNASGGSSRRQAVKSLLTQLKRDYKDVEESIITATARVNLEIMLGYTQHGNAHSFLDDY